MLFKQKISRFGSLISLIAVTAMAVLFLLALPEFLLSVTGRIFAIAWAVMAGIVFVAQTRRLTGGERRIPLEVVKVLDDESFYQSYQSDRFRRQRG
ncbi:MAG: hypothetical protein H6Q73_1970 [Firmicutes bacterium]|nr:hypothetical protein [Bacillota bacterium]